MIVEISKILTSISPKWAFILANGRVIDTTLEDSSLGKILRILKAIMHDIDVGNVTIVKELIIYRSTFDTFVFVIGDIPRHVIRDKFLLISDTFEKEITRKYQKKSIKKKVDVEVILFSMALDEGPAPIEHIPDFPEELTYKVSMKSLLLLSVEREGAKKEMVSFQPYIDMDALGIVYLFQIEDGNARGGAYDSSITVLVDYNLRAIIYEHYAKLEKMLQQTSAGLKQQYYSEKKYIKVLEKLREGINTITFDSVESESLKDEMMEQIKKLSSF